MQKKENINIKIHVLIVLLQPTWSTKTMGWRYYQLNKIAEKQNTYIRV